jgi:hypothetical protein
MTRPPEDVEDDAVLYEVQIRVRGRRELLPNAKDIADALIRGGYPHDGVVACAGAVWDGFGEPCEGEDEDHAASRQWLKARFDSLDASDPVLHPANASKGTAALAEKDGGRT